MKSSQKEIDLEGYYDEKVSKWLLITSAFPLLLCLLAGCGTADSPNGTPDAEQSSSSALETETKEPETPVEYTIHFDMNKTPDDITDDETYTYEMTSWNADGSQSVTEQVSILTVPYSEDAYIESAVPAPEREGYYFSGWQTRPNVGRDDLINGVSPYLWMFGTQSRFGDAATVMYIKDMESLTEDGTATLYARWVEVIDTSTADDLQKIGEDLCGAYRLTEDITLTKDWIPVGCYFTNYEYYDTGWESFDGNNRSDARTGRLTTWLDQQGRI